MVTPQESMSPQRVLGCPACGMRITGTESECPRCHHKFEEDFKFECPFCGSLIPKGSERCPTCLIDLRGFGGQDQESVEKKTNDILEDLIQLESTLMKQEEKSFCCPTCSWLLNGTESKCPKCGRLLSEDEDLTCPICLSPMPRDASECPKCGAILRTRTAPQPESAVPTTSAPTPAVAALQPEVTSADKDASEALQTLGEIERQIGTPRTRKLKTGKVTATSPPHQGGGRGLSNGLGHTNGAGMVNGRSRVNGIGRVNGKVNGRVNGTGAVNGRSLVNGKGISNGLKGKVPASRSRRGLAVRWQFIAVLVAVVITIPTLVYVAYSGPKEPITIDGSFDDWEDATMFGMGTQAGSESINIVEWATVRSGFNIYAHVRTEGPAMASEQPESLFLFMDADGLASTGYLAGGIGADYMIRCEGWNGSVQSSCLEERTSEDGYDWNSWRASGSASARAEGTGVEVRATLPVLPSSSARFLMLLKDSGGLSSETYAAPTTGGLLIAEIGPGLDITDGTIPASQSVGLMTVRFTCQGEGGSVSSVSPALTGVTQAAQVEGFSLSPGEEHTVEITVDSSNAAAEQLVTANLVPSGVGSTFAAVQVQGAQARAYVREAPSSILIDGAFGDWIGHTTVDEDVLPAQNLDIDIDSTGNYTTPDSSYFYVSVKGELLKGDCVPAMIKKPSGTGGGSQIPARKTGEDFLRVYIDADRSASTGLSVAYDAKTVGADHMIEVSGINGRIVSSSFWNYSAGHWILSSANVSSAKDDFQIETMVDAGLVGGVADPDFIVEMSCWKNEFDRASYNPTEPRTLVARVSGTAHTEAWQGGISSSPWATSMSYQRKLFWDGTNFWCFYFSGTDTAHKYSTDGVSWPGRGAVFRTSGINETSIWYDSTNKIVYAVGDRGGASTNVYVQRGTVNPASHLITWAASDSTLAVSTSSLGGKNAYISKDSSGYIWILSSNYSVPNKYQLTAFKSTAVDSISSWSFSGNMFANAPSDPETRGSIVPAPNGVMWSIYSYSGNVISRKYDGSWQASKNIFLGGGTPTILAPPSVVVDTLGVVHVVYGDSRKVGSIYVPAIEYAHNNSDMSFTAAVALDTYLPADVGDIYPTISLDASTNSLYAFWLRTDTSFVGKTVMGRKCVTGTWSNLTISGDTSYPKQYLTSIYSAPNANRICWEWTQNTTPSIHVMFDKIPEFESVIIPVLGVILLCVSFKSRPLRMTTLRKSSSLSGRREETF